MAGPVFESSIKAHLTKFDGFSQKDGISGTHNLNEFNAAAARYNVNILSQDAGAIPGITQIKYQIPSLTRAGDVLRDANGQIVYKNAEFKKTVYDPAVVSDSAIMILGRQAAVSGYRTAVENGARAYNSEAGGVPFRVYLDPVTGTVLNFHPR